MSGPVHDGPTGGDPIGVVEVDARGLRCPLPVIRLAAATRGAGPGTAFRLLATDPAARHDIPAWCRMRGHELREVAERGDHAAYLVVLARGQANPPTPPRDERLWEPLAEGSG